MRVLPESQLPALWNVSSNFKCFYLCIQTPSSERVHPSYPFPVDVCSFLFSNPLNRWMTEGRCDLVVSWKGHLVLNFQFQHEYWQHWGAHTRARAPKQRQDTCSLRWSDGKSTFIGVVTGKKIPKPNETHANKTINPRMFWVWAAA